MQVFIWILIIMIIVIVFSFIPRFRKMFSFFFDSQQFKAFRFVITVFGVISLALGFLKWYSTGNPKDITETANFEVLNTNIGDECILLRGLNDLFHRPFESYFIGGWKPVVTQMDKMDNKAVAAFTEEKGEFVSGETIGGMVKQQIQSCSLNPISGFYIPPSAIFKISFENNQNRVWSIIHIENNYISLNLKITTLEVFCYVEIHYHRKGFINYLFYDYSDYDRWFTRLKDGILELQEININIRTKKGFHDNILYPNPK